MILMRHGQSEFNLHFSATHRDPGIADPRLTPEGHAQAARAAEALATRDIRRIIASPYTRAMQTAAPIAAALNLPVLINPTIRERYHFSCDIGTKRAELAIAWPQHDFSHLDEVWWPAGTEDEVSVAARAARFRDEMAAIGGWDHTLIVSHWAFLLTFTGTSLQNGEWLELPA
jgi:broad specificity phosphatase PhoE